MAGRPNALLVAELLCARMAHDFSGSAAVLSNLLDLAFEQPERSAEPLRMAGETAAHLVQRLKLLRAAWGPPTDPLPLDGLRDLSRALAQSRCTVRLDGLPADTVFPPSHARLLLNLLLLAADGLPAGGKAVLTGSPADLVLAIDGPRAAWPPGLTACIADPGEAWRAIEDPRRVQMALTVLLAASLDCRLSLLMGPNDSAPPPLRATVAP